MIVQSYHIHSVDTFLDAYQSVTFSGHDVQFFPHSFGSARLIITDPNNPMQGLISFPRLLRLYNPAMSIRLKSITYTIAGIDQNGKAHLQDYKHVFHGTVVILPNKNEIRCFEHPLFKRMKLNFLLDSKEFGEAWGVQFIA